MLDDPFSLHAAPLGDSARVVRFRGSEALSTCFSFDIVVSLDDVSADRVETRILHEPARFVIREGTAERVIAGVIGRARVLPTDRVRDAGELARDHGWLLKVRLVPRLWLKSRGQGYRIFQDATATEIATRVWGTSVRVVGAEGLIRRDYTVQYAESDLSFVGRVLADEGLSYTFDASASDDEHADAAIVVSDARSPLGETLPSAVVPFRPESGLVADVAIDSMHFEGRVRERSSTARAYDYRRPGNDLRGEAAVDGGGARGLRAEAAVGRADRHVGTWDSPHVGAPVAARRLEQDRRLAERAEGTSRHAGLRPGAYFELAEHPDGGRDGRYDVVAVEHEGDFFAEGHRYKNRFVAAPEGVSTRPPVPPRRVVQALETATVTGPTGHEIHTDELGRIKVRFHWDASGAGPAESSCWMRTMQTWAGEGWGFQFVPRVGMEVVVGFLGGDVDAPIVLGCVPNVVRPLPYALPASKTRSGIRTRSTRDGTGYNELSFEDRKGYEHVFVRAERDLDVEALRNETHRVGASFTERIGANRFTVVDGNALTNVAGTVTTNVVGDERHVNAASHSTTVRGNLDEQVDGRVERRVQGDLIEQVGGADRRAITGDVETTVRGGALLRSIGSLTTVVGTPDAPQAAVLHVDGTTHASTTGRIELASDERIEIACGDSLLVIGPDRIEISATSILLRGEDAWIQLEAGKARIHAEKKAVTTAKKILDKSEGASVSLTTDAKIDGAHVKLKCPDDESASIDSEDGELTTIELVDQAGRPVPRARYRIALGDGSAREGLLDDQGRAEVRLQGSATVTFPDRFGVTSA